MTVNPERRYTLAEYFELERTSEERYEFFDGEIFCMSGGSRAHDRILVNLLVGLSAKLGGRDCRVFSSGMRIKVPSAPPYRYADVSALCGEPSFEEAGGTDALANPALIVEVLSPSTEAYDRGDRFANYKLIESFTEYLLVAQHRPHVTHYVRQPDGSWPGREYEELSDRLTLSSLGCELTLAEVYQDVSFDVGGEDGARAVVEV